MTVLCWLKNSVTVASIVEAAVDEHESMDHVSAGVEVKVYPLCWSSAVG